MPYQTGGTASDSARARDTASSRLSTARRAPDGTAHFVSAMRSREPMISRCASPTLVSTPTSGRAAATSTSRSRYLRAPISTIATRSSPSSKPHRNFATPTSLFSFSGVAVTATPAPRKSASKNCFVVVLPVLPVTATTVPRTRVRARPPSWRYACSVSGTTRTAWRLDAAPAVSAWRSSTIAHTAPRAKACST